MINFCLTGIVDYLGQYLLSSHKGYLSKAEEWEWLHKFFFSINRRETEPGKGLRRFKAEKDSEKIEHLFKRKKWPVFLGDKEFAGGLRREFFKQKI